MRLNICVTAILFFLIAASLKAQSVGNYTVTRSTGISYSSILNTGDAFNTWRNSGTYNEDDNRSTSTPIGFDFWYNGTRYTSLSVSTNGFIDFSSANSDGGGNGDYGYANTEFTGNGSGTWLAIAPFYDDQTTANGGAPLGGSIKYLLSGTAPYRVFTIEWNNMAVYQNTTPSLNYQVKLYETTGIIEFIYGTMNAGTGVNYSYTCGINAAALNNTPNSSQLLAQQNENTTTFDNGQTNNLSTLPASNSMLTFTPPAPASASGSLTFSGVTTTGMTLNWTNWASNEVGYAIYISDDGIEYDFRIQTAANATSSSFTGLPSGTYYWIVYAVTEGTLSSSVSGSQATTTGLTFTSVQTGNWGTNNTWDRNAVPGAGDNVVISSGHTVTVAANASCTNLSITGTLRMGSNNTARSLTINGNVTVNNGGSFIANTASNTSHAITFVGKDFTNNGTVNFASDGNSFTNITFTRIWNQNVKGSGATTRFNNITVNMSGTRNTLDIQSANFDAATGFLTLTNGTFKFSSPASGSYTPFTGDATLPAYGGIWMNGPNATLNTTGGNIDLTSNSIFRMSAGTFNLGSTNNNSLVSFGGLFMMEGGDMNIAGRYDRNNTNTISKFNMSGGTLTLVSVQSSSTSGAPFMMDVVGSTFHMSGGTIVIQREGGSGSQDLGFINTGANSYSVTGGTLQIGNGSTPASQTIRINTATPIGNLIVNSGNATAYLLNNQTVVGNITITSGTLNANGQSLSLGGDWTQNGTFTPGTSETVTFNGSTQAINATSGTANFSSVVFNNSGTKTANAHLTISGDLTINNSATLNANGKNITIDGNWTNNSGFTAGTGTVTFNGNTTVSGSATTNFNNVIVSGTLTASSGTMGVAADFTNNGTFNHNNGTLNFNGSISKILGSSTSSFYSIMISGSDSLVAPSGNFNVAGNFTNNSKFNHNNGTLVLNGGSAQLINGSASPSFNHINLNNTTGVSLGVNTNMIGTLTLATNGKLVTTGYELILISNASGTARIAVVPSGASITGNIRMQRYIPAKSDRYWYQIAAPVTGTTVSTWQQNIAITGAFTGTSNPGNGVNPNGVSMYKWDAAGGAWNRYPSATSSEPIVTGTGYRTFVRDGNAAYNGGATSARTFSSAGTANIGNFDFTLPYNPVGGTPAGGWNLIGNPYPSDITANLNNAGWTNKVGLDGLAVYMWDSDAKIYVSCNGGVGNCIIPSSQAFWVKVLPGGGSMRATENVKLTGSLTIYRTTAEAGPNYIPVKMINNTTSENDILYLRFEEDATTQFDNQYDAYKLMMSASGVVNNSVVIYSKMNSIDYSIMARPVPTENDTIPLYISGPVGNHTLDFSDDSHLQTNFEFYLIDKFTNTVTDLRATQTYSFNISSNTASYQNRFFVVFKQTTQQNTTPVVATVEEADINIYPNPVTSESIQISLPENISGNIEINIVDMKGIKVYSEKREGAPSIAMSLGKKLKSGVYMVLIESDGKQYRKKIVVQ